MGHRHASGNLGTYSDIRRFPRHLWTGLGNPHPWRRATVVTYVLGGLPVVVTAFTGPTESSPDP
jgi:hypothetical protein